MQLVTHKFSVENYHRMVEDGILPIEKRFELIQGNIIPMSPIGLKHAATVNRLNRVLTLGLQEAAIVSVQNALGLDNESEPQPDIVIYRPEPDFYRTIAPTPQDVYLLIEVADSTLRYDREVKLPLYAENSIAEVWIANLRDQQLEIYREPTGTAYAQKLILKDSETIAPLAFPHVAIAVGEILG